MTATTKTRVSNSVTDVTLLDCPECEEQILPDQMLRATIVDGGLLLITHWSHP